MCQLQNRLPVGELSLSPRFLSTPSFEIMFDLYFFLSVVARLLTMERLNTEAVLTELSAENEQPGIA